MRIAKLLAPFAVLSIVIMGAFVDAQEPKLTLDDTPKAVKKSVKASYPDAKILNVLKEKNEKGATVYEIEMTVKSKGVDIMVDSEGTIYTIEEVIDEDELPKAVKATASKTFPKGKITKVEKVTNEDKKVTYEVFVKIGDKDPFEVLIPVRRPPMETMAPSTHASRGRRRRFPWAFASWSSRTRPRSPTSSCAACARKD